MPIVDFPGHPSLRSELLRTESSGGVRPPLALAKAIVVFADAAFFNGHGADTAQYVAIFTVTAVVAPRLSILVG